MTSVDELCRAVAAATAVVPVGAGTQGGVGGALLDDAGTAVALAAPAGIVDLQPADMTVTLGAGTPIAALDAALAEHGQECPLDPRTPAATVGGVLACGLSGPRRLRHGPLRDRVLEVRFVTGSGRAVRGGGPTVKNVTGYDVPRLLVGSLGTLGLLTQVTLRTQPLPERAAWFRADADPAELRARLHRPACIAWDGGATWVLLEGYAADLDAESAAAALVPAARPADPVGPHRGRIAVAPGAVRELAARLAALDVRWLAEVGVGTVHVASDTEADLGAARHAAHAVDGWLLREDGAPDLDPFGIPLPNPGLHARVKHAFDPERKMNPGRIPYGSAP
jgi:glycolate oxidase FAD binding subunit